MTTETLQRAIHKVPFEPFTLCLADGQRLEVKHPDFIMHPPGARTAVVWVPDQSYYEMIDLLLVVGLKVEETAIAKP